MADLESIVELEDSQLKRLEKSGMIWYQGNHRHTYSDSYLYVTPSTQACNPNLLLNPDFRVNQKGTIQFDCATFRLKYIVDGWKMYAQASNSFVIEHDDITEPIALDCVAQYDGIYQMLSTLNHNCDNYVGKTLTFTFYIDSVESSVATTLFYGFIHDDGWTSNMATISKDTVNSQHIISITATISTSAVGVFIGKITPGAATIYVKWAKVEIGDTFTGYIPPDPVEELIKCQSYYQVISDAEDGVFVPGSYSVTINGTSDSATTGKIVLTLPVPLALPNDELNVYIDTVARTPSIRGYTYGSNNTASLVGEGEAASIINLGNSGEVLITNLSNYSIKVSKGGKELTITMVNSGIAALRAENNNGIFLLKDFAIDGQPTGGGL